VLSMGDCGFALVIKINSRPSNNLCLIKIYSEFKFTFIVAQVVLRAKLLRKFKNNAPQNTLCASSWYFICNILKAGVLKLKACVLKWCITSRGNANLGHFGQHINWKAKRCKRNNFNIINAIWNIALFINTLSSYHAISLEEDRS